MSNKTPRGPCIGCGKVHDYPVTADTDLADMLSALFGQRPEPKEEHPAGAVGRTGRHPVLGVPAIEWFNGDEPPAENTYLFLGAPTVAQGDQATAAIQAMQNLGYTWKDGRWHRHINGLDSQNDEGAPARRLAAVRTCVRLGYTYNGGSLWEPPKAEEQPAAAETPAAAGEGTMVLDAWVPDDTLEPATWLRIARLCNLDVTKSKHGGYEAYASEATRAAWRAYCYVTRRA